MAIAYAHCPHRRAKMPACIFPVLDNPATAIYHVPRRITLSLHIWTAARPLCHQTAGSLRRYWRPISSLLARLDSGGGRQHPQKSHHGLQAVKHDPAVEAKVKKHSSAHDAERIMSSKPTEVLMVTHTCTSPKMRVSLIYPQPAQSRSNRI